jgi:DNA-binding SARP family transcriptional activator
MMAHGKTVAREKLLGLLWGARSDAQARGSLRGVLSDIRRCLKGHAEPPLDANRQQVFIDGSRITSDIDRLLQTTLTLDFAAMEKSLSLYSGEFLESFRLEEQGFEDWQRIEQQNFKDSFRKTLSDWLDGIKEDDQSGVLELIATKLLELDRADEDAHRALIRHYACLGKTSAALRQFEICKTRLREEYNSEVSEETRRLAETVKLPSTDSGSAIKQQVQAGDTTAMPAAIHTEEIALAVLPFNAPVSAQLDAEFGTLISEEIIGAAARFKWFRVLPSRESFRLISDSTETAGKRQIGGAKYVLYGRVIRPGNLHQLKVKLDDDINGRLVWSETFNLTSENLVYPDDIVAQVVGQLETKIRANEIREAYQSAPDELSDYQRSLRALSSIYDLSPDGYRETEELFSRTTARNPSNSWFYSIWALWKMFCLGQAWAADSRHEFEQVGKLAHEAIKRDPDDALALVILGHFESFWVKNLDQGKKLFDYALQMNPYSSFAWMLSSATYSYRGEPLEALQRLERSKFLCPVEQYFEFMYDTASCIAHLFNHDAAQAAPWGEKAVHQNTGFTNGYKHYLVALGHLGETSRFDDCHASLLALEPNFDAQKFLLSFPFARDEDRAFYRAGLGRLLDPESPYNLAGSQPV